MTVRHLTKAEMEAFPEGAVWNAFVNLLAMSEAKDLSETQIPAFHAFWYESEVQNGGHLQYFLNRGADEATNAVRSLRTIAANQHADLLERALRSWQGFERDRPSTSEEYLMLEATDGEFSEYDDSFYAIAPEMNHFLQMYLDKNTDHFVRIGP